MPMHKCKSWNRHSATHVLGYTLRLTSLTCTKKEMPRERGCTNHLLLLLLLGQDPALIKSLAFILLRSSTAPNAKRHAHAQNLTELPVEARKC